MLISGYFGCHRGAVSLHREKRLPVTPPTAPLSRLFSNKPFPPLQRRNLLHGLLLLLLSALLPAAAAGQTLTLHGSVKTADGRPVGLATVQLNQSLGTQTDDDGTFRLDRLQPGTYTWRVAYLGYETRTGQLTLRTGRERLDVTLREMNLQLKDVTVVATQSREGSTSVIGQEAIRHIQPKSLADLLQLVPGNLTANPDLSSLAQAQIRETDSDANNALGTAIVVDGTPLSNDANLQALATGRYGAASSATADGMSDQTTAGRGTDLRTLSADNIESVEVIRGIPSVEYGNLTSGVVVVKTKAGATPWELKAKADPFSKLVSGGKGFALNRGGAANFSIDYSSSYGDTRRRYLGYERITASAGYSDKFGPLSLNVRSAFYSNVNTRRTDPQMTEMSVTYKNKNIGGRLSLGGTLTLDASWISRLDYNLAVQAAGTLDDHHELVHTPDGVVTDVREAGLHEARFLNKAYYADYRIEGLPLNVYLQLKADKYFTLPGDGYTSLRYGLDYTFDANRGRGLVFSMEAPPQSSGAQTLRPRAFSDIPALQNLSFFAEDRLHTAVAGRPLQATAGVRMSRLFLNAAKSGGRHGIFVAEPRINVAFPLLDRHNNALFDELSLTGGYGISNKMPTLLYLYPDRVWFDNVSLSHYGTDESSRLALMTTQVVERTQNTTLKPANSRKWEIGLRFDLGGINGSFTYFNERHRHEFGFASQLFWAHYDRFDVPAAADNVRFNGTDVTYRLDGTTHTAARTAQTDLYTWSRPDNTTRSFKQGVEYTLDLGTWEALRTSLNVDGAWLHIRRTNEKEQLRYIDRTYDYAAIMPAGSGLVSNRFNTNFRFITHIPAVRLIFTTTVQVVWYESSQSVYEDNDGNALYHPTADGTQLAVAPLGFYDKSGTYTPWRPEYATDPEYERMNQRYMSYAFERDVVAPWVLLNFRLTKELGRFGEVSFIANNFPNMSRWHTNRHSRAQRQLYPDMYFGAELKISL